MVTFEHRVVVKNAKQTMQALKQFDPDAAKEINKRISKAAGTVVKSARGLMPSGQALTNWGAWSQGGRDLSYNDANRKVRTTRANMRKRGEAVSNYIGIVNPTPGGAIFELAGRQNPADFFINAIYGKGYGRSHKTNTQRGGVFKAFDDNRGAAVREIEEALKEAEQRLQTYLDSVIGE